jgi:hypothetical protein
VKLIFFNGVLKKKMYVVQPQGFGVEGEKEKVYKFKKKDIVLVKASVSCMV